jgi:hypothetical protein
MISHSASLINDVLMPLIYHTASVLLGALLTSAERTTSVVGSRYGSTETG